MSENVTAPMMLDATGKALVAQLEKMNLLKEAEIGQTVTTVSDWDEVAEMVSNGTAPHVFPVNSKLTVKWSDGAASPKEYDARMRVLDHVDGEVRGGASRPLMVMQHALTLPFDTAFDAAEAFWACTEALEAGTYSVTLGISWGDNCVKGKSYSFTLANPVPAGGVLCGMVGAPDVAPSKWKVSSYATQSDDSPIETVAMAEGEAGTSLGTVGSSPDGDMNSLYRCAYGSNRWATSAVRQYLNAVGDKGTWWAPQTKWDRPPAYAKTRDGYLKGFADAGLVDHMQPVLVKTALPYCDGGTAGGTECDETYDRVWLPSAEQLYWAPGGYGIPMGLEGAALDYYRQLAESGGSPTSLWATHKEYIMCGMDAPTSARYVFGRSAFRGNGYCVAVCNASGSVGYTTASTGYRVAPAFALA